jgi:hypothetical protein
MDGIRPDLVRAATVRLVDVVLESMADGRLDRSSLRRLPPWRAAVLARIAYRAGLMSRRELGRLIAEVIEAGPDGSLAPPPTGQLDVIHVDDESFVLTADGESTPQPLETSPADVTGNGSGAGRGR